jgi:hypothetical protein
MEHSNSDQAEDLLRLPKNRGSNRIVELSKTPEGCRRVQDALKHAPNDGQRKELVQNLQGHVLHLAMDPHGNHVLQLAIDLLPPPAVDFIRLEIEQHARTLAHHTYGCRVLERLIEHFPHDKLGFMIDKVLTTGKQGKDSDSEFFNICQDQYANFVIQHVLEHGDDDHRDQIVRIVRNQVGKFVNNSFACGVLNKALTYGAWPDQQEITKKILDQEPLLADMATNVHGFASTQRVFKVAALADAPEYAGQGMLNLACEQLLRQHQLDRIKQTKHGHSLLIDILPKNHRGILGAQLQAQPACGQAW